MTKLIAVMVLASVADKLLHRFCNRNWVVWLINCTCNKLSICRCGQNRTRRITRTEHCNSLGHGFLSVGRMNQIDTHTCLKNLHLIFSCTSELNY